MRHILPKIMENHMLYFDVKISPKLNLLRLNCFWIFHKIKIILGFIEKVEKLSVMKKVRKEIGFDVSHNYWFNVCGFDYYYEVKD